MEALKTKKWKLGYRVVRKQGNRLQSTHAGRNYCDNGRGYKVYKVGHITRRTRGNGPLAVFDNINTALRFRDTYCDSRKTIVYKCRYLESDDNKYWIKVNSKRRFSKSLIFGKRFADAVELIEAVTI